MLGLRSRCERKKVGHYCGTGHPVGPQVKAYTTRVGEGPYPTEIHGDLAEELREEGAEYGTTTGRPRRIGWLDIPALLYACRCRPGLSPM